jgi:hypothetical protein
MFPWIVQGFLVAAERETFAEKALYLLKEM